MNRSRVLLAVVGALGFAVSLGVGATSAGSSSVSEDEAARLVGGQICEARKIRIACKRLDPSCPELVACWAAVPGHAVELTDPTPCGNCGDLYGTFIGCGE